MLVSDQSKPGGRDQGRRGEDFGFDAGGAGAGDGWSTGDVNADGVVNVFDLILVAQAHD